MITMRVMEAVKIVVTVVVTLRGKNCSSWRQTYKQTETQNKKKEIVPACVKLTVWEFFKYEEKQH